MSVFRSSARFLRGFACLLLFQPALAEGDVAATGIALVREPGGTFHVEVDYSAAWGAEQGEFAYTLLVTQKRDGQVVAVPLNVTETVHPADVCDDTCGGTCSVGACHYMIDKDPRIFEGSCAWEANLCPDGQGNKTLNGCTCKRSDHKPSSTLKLVADDLITFSITPAPSLTGDDPSNNSLSITVR